MVLCFPSHRIDESDTARSERQEKWDKFLETGEVAPSTSTSTTAEDKVSHDEDVS
jgi:hypothetical protein